MKFFETVRNALRTQHYAYRTEKTYMHWIKKYVHFTKPVHPREAGVDGVKRFATHLAVDRNVSATTQNQAIAALQFLYKLYGIEVGELDIVRARKSTHLPAVLSHDEAMRLLEQLNGQYRIGVGSMWRRTLLFISRRKSRFLHLIHLRYAPCLQGLGETGVAVAKEALCDRNGMSAGVIGGQIRR